MKFRALTAAGILLLALTQAAGAVPIPGGLAPSWCEKTAMGYRCMYGPVDVGAGESVKITNGIAAPSEAGFITSARANLVDLNGESIGQEKVHMHHVVYLNPSKNDLTCDDFGGMFPDYDRFFASGKERTRFVLPAGYGYFWSNMLPQPFTGSAPYWGLNAHLDGIDGESEVFIELTLGFVPAGEAQGMVDTIPVWLDVRNCSPEPVFDVERGSGHNGVYAETWDYTLPIGGRFVFLAGHLHDGGLRISLHDLSSRRALFQSRAVYPSKDAAHAHHSGWDLAAMTVYRGASGIGVEQGDHLRLTAYYDSTHEWDDVMGIMVGALVPE